MNKFSVVLGRTQLYLSRLCLPCTYFIKLVKANSSTNKMPANNGLFQKGYKKLFGKYLYVTNTVGPAALMCLADLMQQKLESVRSERHKISFDWKRNVHMAEVGAVQGYLSHYFYIILDSYLPGVKLLTIAKKLIIDQGIYAPFCIIFFFLGMDYLNNTEFKTSLHELKEKFLLVYLVDCTVWIPTQFINFYLLPSKFRVLYLSLISVCYNMFLSYVKHNDISYQK